MSNLTLSYSPKWAEHVSGNYEPPVFDEDGKKTEGQKWVAKCSKCNATTQGVCETGVVSQHIANFALVHAHKEF